MADAEIDEVCNEIVAHLPGVRRALKEEAQMGAARAKAKLAMHRDRGDSRITVTQGITDAWVGLDDSRGAKAAGIINIETGALGAAW